jgi:hypothetical protein
MADVAEALAFVQKVPTTEGGSLYEHLTHLVVKVCDHHAYVCRKKASGARRSHELARLQVLEERPGDAVDVLETALLVKKTNLGVRETAAVAPPEVQREGQRGPSGAALGAPAACMPQWRAGQD